jgi:hypothetical protein
MQLDYERAVKEALSTPGKINAAYSAFWNYSFGNQMLAMWQLGKPDRLPSTVERAPPPKLTEREAECLTEKH